MTVRLFDPADEGDDSPLTVGAIIALYLDHARSELCPSGYAIRSHYLTDFARDHGHLPLSEAKPRHLRQWVSQHPTWRSDWTKKAGVVAVHRCFNWAAGDEQGLAEKNPFKGVSHPEGEPGRPMTGEEFFACLRNSSTPFRRVLLFLRLTGCRPGEMSAIEPKHVDLRRNSVTLDQHKTRKLQKRKRPRVIVLHPVATALLAFLIRTMAPGQERVFVTNTGSPWRGQAISNRMQRLRKKLRLPRDCKPYGLRHKFGTDAIKSGVGLKTLAVLLGHTTTRVTERYVHIDGDLDHLGNAVGRTVGGG